MALTITAVNTGTNGTSTTSNLTLTVTGVTASVGDVLLLCIAASNSGFSGTAAVVGSIADNASGSTNVYTQRGTTGNRSASATPNDGASQLFYECPVTTALSGNTVTITFSGNNNPQKAVQIYRMQPGSGETVEFVSVGTPTDGAGSGHAAATVSVTDGDTIFGMAAIETDDAITGDSDTTNGSWSTIETRLADGGTDASCMSSASQYKTVNATGNQSWACTSGVRNSARNTIIYRAVAPLAVVADAGSYSLTGTAASLERGYEVVAGAGSYALTGSDATLTKAIPPKKVVAGAGSYSLTGQDAALERGREVAADAGSYALTGQDAALERGREVTADAGSYALTGQDATLEHIGAVANLSLSATEAQDVAAVSVDVAVSTDANLEARKRRIELALRARRAKQPEPTLGYSEIVVRASEAPDTASVSVDASDPVVTWDVVVRASESPDTASVAVETEDLGDEDVLAHFRALGYEIEGDADADAAQADAFMRRMADFEREQALAEEKAIREYFELIGYDVVG